MAESSVRISAYAPGDQSALESFYREVYIENGFPLDLDVKHADLRQIPTKYPAARGGFWNLQDHGVVIGTVALRALSPEVAELKRLFLRHEAQGSGHGLALAQHALGEARRLGYRRIRLDTTSKSQAALRLFRGLGFVEIERYNNNPDAEFWMELDLTLPARGVR